MMINKPFGCLFNFFVGIRIEENKDVEVWHETVCLFSVTDVSSNELLGYFYLDIHSRLVFFVTLNLHLLINRGI